MLKFLIPISYIVAGIGCFYIFSGKVNVYSILILMIGLFGILVDLLKIKKNAKKGSEQSIN
ncbi:hypothetical protein [Ureibacillus acetophenoni]|uniref:Uncharacterized protein n=1 Tax=Ureibacillus acetophenoni TaxID=614649 RepID=A0A285UAN0_9BACL|nr:hypothetical protein [Ureibacillus acetophenoni]SOC37381.1 hypothetical protein SAMN05877842_103172 [Ureibacillus acetophenoni]